MPKPLENVRKIGVKKEEADERRKELNFRFGRVGPRIAGLTN